MNPYKNIKNKLQTAFHCGLKKEGERQSFPCKAKKSSFNILTDQNPLNKLYNTESIIKELNLPTNFYHRVLESSCLKRHWGFYLLNHVSKDFLPSWHIQEIFVQHTQSKMTRLLIARTPGMWTDHSLCTSEVCHYATAQ